MVAGVTWFCGQGQRQDTEVELCALPDNRHVQTVPPLTSIPVLGSRQLGLEEHFVFQFGKCRSSPHLDSRVVPIIDDRNEDIVQEVIEMGKGQPLAFL